MTDAGTTPLRQRMIPSRASKPALPGSGRFAHPRDGRQCPECAHPGDQGFRRLPQAFAGQCHTRRDSRTPYAHDGYRRLTDDLQCAHCGAAVLCRHHLRARRVEALHAILHPVTQAAGGVQCRGGFRHPDGHAGSWPEVSGGAHYLLRRRAASRRGL